MGLLPVMRAPIHPEGFPIIAGFAVFAAALALASPGLGVFGLVLLIWCVWFFRDPDRTTPVAAGTIVSPADGRILPLTHAAPPPELGVSSDPCVRISIFMNVFDVHVNRIPADGEVTAMAYRPGRFINAAFDKASEQNERLAVAIRTSRPSGAAACLVVVQIAGLVARRIKCRLKSYDLVRRGERYGIIRFGSRLDVYLPPGLEPQVTEGQRVKAGETVLARWSEQ
jgi:phosphatidylserine decarboxylase